MKPRRSIVPVIRLANPNKGIAQVPAHLKPMQFGRYPPDNAVTFERWYLNSWSAADERERVYLPIQWTALYCNNGYGNHPVLHTIQKYIDDLDKSKKYYTVVQYDDGILNNLDGLDIEVCAMAGPRIDFALPLLCTPHKFNFQPNGVKKDIFASFIGSYTHPIRAQMVQQLKGKEGYYIETTHHPLLEYCQIMARSKYALCPRGYGQSSFRIQEAIDFGAIPVYISDEFILPYGRPFSYGLLVNQEDIDSLGDVLTGNYLWDISERDKHLFTYHGCKAEILKHLSNEQQQTNNKGGNTEV